MTPFKSTLFNSIDFETIKNKWVYDVRNYRKLLIKPLQKFHHVDGGTCLSVLIITGWWPGSGVGMEKACLEKNLDDRRKIKVFPNRY